MATGEYVSVSSQNDLIIAEVSKERHEHETNPDEERRELAAAFTRQGVDQHLAEQVAAQNLCAPGTRSEPAPPGGARG